MADAKQILVVDDHFEMLEMLRSMLELSEQDYEVLAVPSAEEGLLELLRTQFDLLITDVRLPGMSGFDLVRRVRQQRPNIPIIMLTAYTSQQGQKEADALGVYRYFAKPLDTDEMLTAVAHALFGESAAPAPSPDPIPSLDFTMPSQARKRLETLRADTGAAGLFLATVAGQILFRIDAQLDLALEELATTLAQNVQNSFLLAGQLEEDQPLTIQYHVGRGVSLYHANVGKDYFVTLVFRSEARRGRIGTIWVFTQRAIHELQKTLRPLTELSREQPDASTSAVSPPDETKIPAPASPPSDESKIPSSNPPITEDPPPKPFTIPEANASDSEAKGNINDLLSTLKLDETAVSGDVESFWNQALTDAAQGENEDTLSWEEATELIAELRQNQSEPEQEGEGPPAEEVAANLSELLSALNLDETDIDSDDVEAFWDEALGGDSKPGTEGLSLEEAKEQGLVSLEKEDED